MSSALPIHLDSTWARAKRWKPWKRERTEPMTCSEMVETWMPEAEARMMGWEEGKDLML
jgi:hypothetical protein